MMLTVGDANDSHGTKQPQRLPEPIDAEIVDEKPPVGDTPPAAGASSAPSEEELRQYQQFLEFQKFQEWKRQQGGDIPADIPSGATAQPWWKKALRLLRFKFVRRLLYVFLTILLIWAGIHYYFGDNHTEDNNGAGVPGRENPKQAPVTSATPQDAATAVYSYIALSNTPETPTCDLFSESARAEFARNWGAPDCATAARKIHSELKNPTAYASPTLIDAVTLRGKEAEVSSCKGQVEGGPRLGTFLLRQDQKGGWMIEGHQNESPDCVTG